MRISKEVYLSKIEKFMETLEKLYKIEELCPDFFTFQREKFLKDAAERNLQKAIEILLDLGKLLVKEYQLKIPSTYREIFILLSENGLFPYET